MYSDIVWWRVVKGKFCLFFDLQKKCLKNGEIYNKAINLMEKFGEPIFGF